MPRECPARNGDRGHCGQRRSDGSRRRVLRTRTRPGSGTPRHLLPCEGVLDLSQYRKGCSCPAVGKIESVGNLGQRGNRQHLGDAQRRRTGVPDAGGEPQQRAHRLIVARPRGPRRRSRPRACPAPVRGSRPLPRPPRRTRTAGDVPAAACSRRRRLENGAEPDVEQVVLEPAETPAAASRPSTPPPLAVLVSLALPQMGEVHLT